MSRTAKIHREIAYIMYVRNVWICRKIEYPELRKFIRILRTLYMYRMSRFPGKFNIQSCGNSTENCVHYICTECLENCVHCICTKIQFEIVYIIYVRNVWICRKIEYLELRKFNGKLCTFYMYGSSGFAAKLNIQKYENSTGTVYIIYAQNVLI